MKFEACRDNSEVADPLSLTLTPHPLVIKEGAKVQVHFHTKLLKPIKPGSKIRLKLQKKLLIWIPVPCVPLQVRYF